MGKRGPQRSVETEWKDCYKRFCDIYPGLGKKSVGFIPLDRMMIKIVLKGCHHMIFDGYSEKVTVVD